MKSIKTTITTMLAVACVGITFVSCSSSSNWGQVLSTIGSGGTVANVFSSVIGMDKVTQQGLIGTWTYRGPGCAFTSENLLAKAGGEVAATKAEQEMEPYFKKVGINSSNTRITFNQDMTFAATIAGKSFSGQYTFDEAKALITLKTLLLNFNCYAKREYGGISILFESKKLLTVLQTMAMLSGNTTYQKVAELSKNYDGVRLGFDMKK
jgi:hypothetical protein